MSVHYNSPVITSCMFSGKGFPNLANTLYPIFSSL